MPKPARDPFDHDLTELIGELSMRSDDFRRMWATHDVTQYRSGTQYFHHELVGDLDLSYESFDLAGDIAQTLVVYTAKPGTPVSRRSPASGSRNQRALRTVVTVAPRIH